MHLYSNTDFPGLPVIQFLIILHIESNSNNSTVRNRLLLQFIHFRKDLLEQKHSIVFENYTKLPETSFYSKNLQILLFLHSTQKDNSTSRNLQFIH